MLNLSLTGKFFQSRKTSFHLRRLKVLGLSRDPVSDVYMLSRSDAQTFPVVAVAVASVYLYLYIQKCLKECWWCGGDGGGETERERERERERSNK